MFAQKVFLVATSLTCLFGCVWSYALASYADYSLGNPIYNIGAGHPSETRISGANWHALNHYGYQIGKPLLVKGYGPLTNLYSALAPKRSFVGTAHPGFYKDCSGHIKFRGESSIGALAV